MMHSLKRISLMGILLALQHAPLCAQDLPEFNMMDTTVTICKGILYDSEEGPGGLVYGNNEDFTFTIAAGSTITMVFSPVFCLEQGFDYISFYDGPTTNSPQIGPAYTGIVAPPPIVAYSGFLTVHFVSDHSVAYCGFEAQWTAEVEPPVPPVMTIPTPPACNSPVLDVQFSYPIPCSAIQGSAFVLSGSGDPVVAGASATGCSGGETSSAQLQIEPPFDRNCPYDLTFRIGIPDRCDSIWYFFIDANTQVVSCPLGVLLEASQDTICAGQCVQLYADVQGCLSYTYSWSDGINPNAGPHMVCPVGTTTYTVTITEVGTGQTATGSRTITVIDPQVEPVVDNICQSADPFDLVSTPPGGWWSGPGILDELGGTFHPDSAGPGAHVISYQVDFGCTNTVVLVVDSMDAGLPKAACPGTDPFLVSGFSPQGGTWSGPFITPFGLFDPSTIGSYTVTYSAGNCTDTKIINVDHLVGPAFLDTVCQSEVPFQIPVTPFGGRWSGPGIVDTLYGVFDPHEAGGGTHLLTYTMQGCSDQFSLHVKPVDIGDDRSACPSQPPYALTPAAVPPGGYWQGDGIADPQTGLYDPAQAYNGTPAWDIVTYHAPNGCVDTIGIWVTYTMVMEDTVFFCMGDEPLILTGETVGRTPWDGVWVGAGTSMDAMGDWYFDPTAAGVGLHSLRYTANGCEDHLIVVVHPDELGVQPITVCGAQEAFIVASVPPGATFSGPGIVDPATGLFDPVVAGAGAHTILYQTPAGCEDVVLVEVFPFVTASIGGVQTSYCSNDIDVQVALSPEGGTFSGLPDPVFNPSTLAPGEYTLYYSVGSGACTSTDSISFTNHPALEATLSASLTTICGGGASHLLLDVSGGRPGQPYFIQWDNGLFPVEGHTVSPEENTTYTVMVMDYCSDPIILSVTIEVYPEFTPEFTFSEMQCYGEPGFVQGNVPQEGDYTFTWATSPPQTGAYIEVPAGQSFGVVVENDESGCSMQQLITIPSWPPVTALFSVNPSMECVPFDQADVTFIDLSHNAVGGEWTINGATVPYVPGEYPNYDHGVAGYYDVSLHVYNEGGCTSDFATSVCILASTRVFVPDAFSPNGDGVNDVLYVRAPGLQELSFQLYDRWGSKVFESRETGHGWDGNLRGAKAPSGVYVYVLSAVMFDGEVVEMTGDVTLVR